MPYVNKPGMMKRALFAWTALNLVMAVVVALTVWIVGQENVDNWYIALPLVIAIIITEWAISSATIADIVTDWIKQQVWTDTPPSNR